MPSTDPEIPARIGPSSPSERFTVVDVRCHEHRSPLLRPFVTAQRRTDSVAYVVAEVLLARAGDREGAVLGQGSAAETVAVTGESAATIHAAIGGPLRASVRGMTGTIPALAERLHSDVRGMTSARAAVDVALHDAWARLFAAPLTELLGAATGSTSAFSMDNDMTVSLEDPATMKLRAGEAVQAGHRILKIKLGRDAEEDRRRLAAVMEAAPGVRLRLDANQGWTVPEAIRAIGRLEADGLPVDLVEQPVAARDLEGLRAVREAVATPIMADEAVWDAQDARRIAELGAADALNIKLAKTGGVREALAIADVAAEAGLTCMIGAMMEPRISITAAAHLAAAHPAITMIDLDAPAWFAADRPRGGYREEDGRLHLLGGPGLGLETLPADVDPDPHPADDTAAPSPTPKDSSR